MIQRPLVSPFVLVQLLLCSMAYDAQTLINRATTDYYAGLSDRNLKENWGYIGAQGSGGFLWVPASAIVNWTDSGGNKSGNLATFQATADDNTVSVMSANNKSITEFRHLKKLPQLTTFSVPNNLLTSLDLSGCANLTTVSCIHNSIATLTTTGCTGLTDLAISDNRVSTVDVSSIPALQFLSATDNPNLITLNLTAGTNLKEVVLSFCHLTSLNCHNLAALTKLWCDNNNLGVLTISGCTALTNLRTNKNTAVTIN